MKKSMLYAAWGVLYIICLGLGFIQEPAGILRICMIFACLLFFVPPMLLLASAKSSGDDRTRKLLRNLAAISLSLTLVLLIGNILAAVSGNVLGTVLHILLAIFSAPMFCGVYWVISLFLWAVLLFASLRKFQ